ncbi:BRD4-interacting chromatin-remodeling complex-associated protein-like isoform X1 [Anguilla rostrata]|uniref:BRD4-interacting chromatin-remodeling complex-associated protein-like isoform X1 n=1 Tax=Anguilla rostrata TaxID=7938 RepID=UPI0030CF8361
MDDEDARRLLDIIGDEQALNDYLHGPNSKSINEDDVTNTTFGSANSFFISNSGGTDSALKDGGSTLSDVGGAGGAGLQLSSSLQFISAELGEASPSGAELGEEQPFDILQKSLLEADITEQTLAQEALLDSPPPSAPFAQQLASGGFGGVTGAGPSPLPYPGAQTQGVLQQVSQQPLHNGSAGHIQVLGAFGGTPSVMTINNIERPQIVLRPGGGAGGGGGGQGGMFAPPAAGQVGVPFKACGTSIPLQNIIFQRGPSPQALVRPIQPKPLQVGGQTVYNISGLGLQAPPTATPPQPGGCSQSPQQVKVVNHAGNIVIQSPLGQPQQQQPGQFLLPTSLSLTPTSSTHGLQALNGQILQTSDRASVSTTYSILTNHSAAVQLVAGQSFAGQLIVNQGAVPGGVGQQVAQVSRATGGVAKLWPGGAVQNRFTLVSSAGAQALEGGATGPQGQQQVSVSLVPLTQDPVPATNAAAEPYAFSSSQDTSSAAQFINLPGNKILKTVTPISQVDSTSTTNTQLGSQKRPAPQQLTKEILVLQQLRRDQAKVLAADRLPFSSLEDAAHQLLPYHVYQGSLPSNEDFKTVDEEFETAATHVLKRTQSMLNKYRRLLLVEAERTNPSSELVMIDRTFNQEERSNLTRDKRLALVDREGFLEDFCCLAKPEGVRSAGPETGPVGVTELQGASSFLPRTEHHHGGMKDLGSVQADENGRGSADPAHRTEPQPGCKDPGWEGPEVSLSEHLETAIKNILDLKKTRRGSYVSHAPSATPSSVPHQALFPPQRQGPEKPLPSEHSQPPTVAHTDSVLEAAVNSILEC